MKYIILSQPKAGTYLCANLLIRLGISYQGLHLNKNRYQQYFRNEKIKSENKRFNDSIKLVNENEFCVSHVSAEPNIVESLSKFKKVVLTRDYNERLASWQRWKGLSSNNIPRKLLGYQTSWDQFNWLDENDIFHLTFNDIIDINVPVLDRLQIYLFEKVILNSTIITQDAKNDHSLTKSSLR